MQETHEKRVIDSGDICIGAFDYVRALEQAGGDYGLLQEVVGLFAEEASILLGLLESSLYKGDAEGLRRTAHRLKGAAATVGSEKLALSARTMEQVATAGNLAAGEQILLLLRTQMADFRIATRFLTSES